MAIKTTSTFKQSDLKAVDEAYGVKVGNTEYIIGDADPTKFLPADGSVYLQSAYPKLFNKVGLIHTHDHTVKSATVGDGTLRTTSVAWSPDLSIFALLGDGGLVATSSDGVSWTTHSTISTPPTTVWYGMCWAEGLSKFVAVGETTDSAEPTVMTSLDGVNWTQTVTGLTGDDLKLHGVTWSSDINLLVAVGFGGSVLTSPDGITWTSQTSGNIYNFYDVTWSEYYQRFYACGNWCIFWSSDGVNWTGTTDLDQWILSIVSKPNSHVLVGTGLSGVTWESTDGETWVLYDFDHDYGSRSFWSEEAGMFVMAGDNNVYCSYDGVTWPQELIYPKTFEEDEEPELGEVAYAPSLERFVMAGNVGRVGYSAGPAYDTSIEFAVPLVYSPYPSAKAYIRYKA